MGKQAAEQDMQPGRRKAEPRGAGSSDLASANDSLRFGPFVDAVFNHLTDRHTTPPLTLSVEADWGAGKSSFMRQLYERLRQRRDGLVVWFNPWRNDKEESVWASFAVELVRQLRAWPRPLWDVRRWPRFLLRRLWACLRLSWQRFDWDKGWWDFVKTIALLAAWGALITFGLWWRAAAPKGFDEVLKRMLWLAWLPPLAGGLGLAWTLGTKFVGNPLRYDLRKYCRRPDYEGRICFAEKFSADLLRIVPAYAGKRRVYVFIDDLDRCDAPKAAELLKALNLLIPSAGDVTPPRLVYIFGIDRLKVAAGLAAQFKDVLPFLEPASADQAEQPSAAQGRQFGMEFIQKFVQLPLQLPVPVEADWPRLVQDMFGVQEAADDSATPAGKSERSQESAGPRPDKIAASDRPPQGGADRSGSRAQDPHSDAAAAGGTSPADEARPRKVVDAAQVWTDFLNLPRTGEITTLVRMAAPFLRSNPRRVKQFINLLRLRARILMAVAASQGHDRPAVCCVPQLAKLVAVSIAKPTLLNTLQEDPSLLDRLLRAWAKPAADTALAPAPPAGKRAPAAKESESPSPPVDKPPRQSPAEAEILRDDLLRDLMQWGQSAPRYAMEGLDIRAFLSTLPPSSKETAVAAQAAVDREERPTGYQLAPDEFNADHDFSVGLREPTDHELLLTFDKGPEMRLTRIHAGAFQMGSPPGQGDPDEQPQHQVRITRDFFVGVCPVTQAQYAAVMGANPSRFQGQGDSDGRPVERVSWHAVEKFCQLLSAKTHRRVRLLTEAEWEFSCRAGSTGKFCFGDDEGRLGEYAWYSLNSGGETHPAGQKRANAWNLHDMHGNVWEWCADWYGANYYGDSPQTDPQGPAVGTVRVLRGGGWDFNAQICRSAFRHRYGPGGRYSHIGFRVVVDL